MEDQPTRPLVSIVTGEPYGPRVRHVDERAEEESSDDEPESESDDESRYLKIDATSEVPAEFWHMQKLIKYMKAGNQTATTVSLCLLKDYELNSKVRLLSNTLICIPKINNINTFSKNIDKKLMKLPIIIFKRIFQSKIIEIQIFRLFKKLFMRWEDWKY